MRATLILIAIALLCAGLPLRAAETGGDAKPVILLSGFEPFGGDKINASWEVVKTFEGRELDGYRIKTVLLPVVYDEMEKPLLDAIKANHPAIVISFGVGTPVVQIETVARNSYHPQKPLDNKSLPPPREAIVPGAPAEIPTALPADKILNALKDAKIGAQLSKDAGGYLCNECFYRLVQTNLKIAARGFIHVPPFGTRDPAGGTFDQEKLCRAAEIAIRTTLAAAAPASKPK
jgi:pyroglutamyl-peptidase